ncbi:Aminomethyltransferase folate-binding domain-containing protein [Dacryopinax primogenitus]|uniref:Aminomethyltransferase folate-binding domain-containing protein n=1 Tax=Dacryopinax primogenitus (strain DJM 731) TaxID=1858805 RepID=M5FNK0_DACPD|nr:Aminomethyltransferase folate-binding domain-containing protein [Dacryopinax primogenitus]EJT97580.1 Aminomethyltransferase folate-binding domain-containing protein [Dacryopinax primogenitus]
MNRVHRFIRSTPLCRTYFTAPTVAPSAAIVPNRSLLKISSSDATEFLNGLTTRKVIPKPSAGIFSTFIHAQGRVLYDCFIYPVEDGFIIEYDRRPILSLRDYLRRYVLRSRVKFTDVTDQWSIYQLFGGYEPPMKWQWQWGPGGALEPVWEDEPAKEFPSALDRRAPGMGRRWLIPTGGKPPTSGQGYTEVDSMAYTLHRVMIGVPEGADEIVHGQALPFDMNLDMMGGIDFRKGCYVGQELLVRTYHTGIVRKRTWPVTLYRKGDEPPFTLMILPEGRRLPPPGTAIPIPGARGKGRLLCAYQNVGLAVLPLSKGEKSNGEVELALNWEEDPDWMIMPRHPKWWPTREGQHATLRSEQ